MFAAPETRLVIVGNSGSGKSTLAERIGTALHLPVHDLDLLHWHKDGRRRDEADAKALVTEVATGGAWVIEGVYGWLAEIALRRATSMVWIDIPWGECQDGLVKRGLRRGMTPIDQDALLIWAEDYWTRTTSSSFVGHKRLYDMFPNAKTCLRSRAEISAFQPERPSFCQGSEAEARPTLPLPPLIDPISLRHETARRAGATLRRDPRSLP